MKTYKVDSTQFTTNITPISSYILGLLWADGYVKYPYDIQLATTYPDADYFIPLFLKTGKWKYYDREFQKHKNWKKACTIKTSNRPLVNFLMSNGYTVKSKESADKILSVIPNELHHYWFRGLLDGDGHIHTDNKGSHSISFSSSINQDWNYLSSLCKKLNIQYHIKKENRNGHSGSCFSVYGKYKTINLCNYIYSGYPYDNLGLNRKYDKFLQIKITEEKNRYVGVCSAKNGNWRAYTSAAKGNKPKSLGLFNSKEKALEAVKKFYDINPKLFMS